MNAPIRPATLAYDAHGTPFSETYGDVYHSCHGGPGQAAHVFLQGNDLPARWRDAARFVILETGFGTGLNFLTTAEAWLDTPHRCARLHYLALEKHPFGVADLARLHEAWPHLGVLAADLRAGWPPPLSGSHRIELAAGRIVLTLFLGDAVDWLPRIQASVDAYYLDGFAPDRNPDLWSGELCNRLARLAAPGATLATWSVAGPVRRALAESGFSLERRPGYAGKREMLCGRYAPPAYREAAAAPPPPTDRHALVLGAGLAGTACCERLAARGWRVDLIERHAGPAAEASGNHAGIFHPLLARDDSPLARLSRTAFLYALRRWRALAGAGHPFPGAATGLVQLARDARHAALQRELPEAMGYPSAYVGFHEVASLAALAHAELTMPGWLLPEGGWGSPRGLCQAYLGGAGEAVRDHFGQSVARLEHRDGHWQAFDSAGARIAEAPALVLANGLGAGDLACSARLPMQAVRGQVSLIPAGALPALRMPVCREGYVTPALDGWHCVGASYDLDGDASPRAECDAGNLHRLARLLAGFDPENVPADIGHRVGFRAVPPDRLPLAGALPDHTAAPRPPASRLAHMPRLENAWGLLGYASRGIVWSALMAELVASAMEGEPLPLTTDLAEAVDPARFMLRLARKGKGPASGPPEG